MAWNALLILLLSSAFAAEWTVEAGADIAPSSHGVLNVYRVSGPWSGGLYTDTLELRYSPSGDRGRSWAAVRAEGGAAGLMISPWSEGAPDPDSAVSASYAGVEGGGLRYLPRGFYAGAQGSARFYAFSGVYADRPQATVDALFGYWSEGIQGWSRVGVDAWPGQVSPHAHVQLSARPDWRIAPRAEIRAGWGLNQDPVTRTRLGGINPYVVPLAGAGWGEFWVEDYAAARVGGGFAGERFEADLLVDAVVFDGQRAAGFGVDTTTHWGPNALEVAAGFSPFIERKPGVAPATGWVLYRRTWGAPLSSSS